MPKAMNYTKGSVIYFSGDEDERIFIIQKGMVILSSADIETKIPVTEYVKEGEFFGVKSALGHFPREETATVVTETAAIVLTLQEFETMFAGNKQVIMKMMRVFSNQLRAIHKKTESILKNDIEMDQEHGMLSVAQSFYDDEEYLACCNVCEKMVARFPILQKKEAVGKLYATSRRYLEFKKSKVAKQDSNIDIDIDTSGVPSGVMKQFSLPAFARFAKVYEPGSVIIAEYEPGDCFYLIQSGKVQLVKCVKGSKKNLDILKPGEFFGEMAILENSPRSATCIAANRVEVLEFNKQNFEILIMGNPQIALILLKLFCKRIYDQKRRFRILVIEDIQARVADVFLMFNEMNKNPQGADRTRRFPLTINDIAHWAGIPFDVAREEVNKFAEKRKVEVHDTYIIVNNIVDMKRIVDTRSTIRV